MLAMLVQRVMSYPYLRSSARLTSPGLGRSGDLAELATMRIYARDRDRVISPRFPPNGNGKSLPGRQEYLAQGLLYSTKQTPHSRLQCAHIIDGLTAVVSLAPLRALRQSGVFLVHERTFFMSKSAMDMTK